MLELRPICENCGCDLPPDSLEARICSYECTFCRECVESVLHNVCPNCGGGFVPRPVRPATNWKDNNYLGADPPTAERRFRPVDTETFLPLQRTLESIDPNQR